MDRDRHQARCKITYKRKASGRSKDTDRAKVKGKAEDSGRSRSKDTPRCMVKVNDRNPAAPHGRRLRRAVKDSIRIGGGRSRCLGTRCRSALADRDSAMMDGDLFGTRQDLGLCVQVHHIVDRVREE